MSAVVQTGSKDARSACGTKVMVVAFCALTICGVVRAVIPARLDVRKSRRLMAGPPVASRKFYPCRSRRTTRRTDPLAPGFLDVLVVRPVRTINGVRDIRPSDPAEKSWTLLAGCLTRARPNPYCEAARAVSNFPK